MMSTRATTPRTRTHKQCDYCTEFKIKLIPGVRTVRKICDGCRGKYAKCYGCGDIFEMRTKFCTGCLRLAVHDNDILMSSRRTPAVLALIDTYAIKAQAGVPLFAY